MTTSRRAAFLRNLAACLLALSLLLLIFVPSTLAGGSTVRTAQRVDTTSTTAPSSTASSTTPTSSTIPSSTTTTPSSTTTTSPLPVAQTIDPALLAAAQAIVTKVEAKAAEVDLLAATYEKDQQQLELLKSRLSAARGALRAAESSYSAAREVGKREVQSAYVSLDTNSTPGQFALPAGLGAENDGAAGAYARAILTVRDHLESTLETAESARASAVVRLRAIVSAQQATTLDARRAVDTAKTEQAALSVLMGQEEGSLASYATSATATSQAQIAALAASGTLSLFTGVANPPAVLPEAKGAINYALAQIGKPYLWGGNGPEAYDCSGLVQQAWQSVGIGLPRVADEQAAATIHVDLTSAKPGDLVFFDSPVGHVGIYLGNGLMVDAPHTGSFVRIDSIWWSSLVGFGRVSR